MASRAPRGFFDRIVHTAVDTFPVSQMRVSLHTATPWPEFGSCVLDLTELSWRDATPGGVGDPFAGLIRTIDELLEDE